MRQILLSSAILLALGGSARADLVSNPGIFPSTPLVAGKCMQATGQNTVGTTNDPCGVGTGSGNVVGPSSSTIGAIAVWSNGTGTALADSNILAANIPTLGANNVWGGLNTYEIRPLFNGNVPYDQGNLPAALAPYLLTATAAGLYETQAHAAATYATILGVQSAYMPFTGGTFTGPVTFNQAPSINGAAVNFRGNALLTNNVLRWNVGADGAESGGSSGSDLHFYRYDDTGVFEGTALAFSRATGVATFSAVPTVNGQAVWYAGNLNPANFATPANITAALAPYLLTATANATFLTLAGAAGIYETQAHAAATYTTPAEVDAALAGFLTKVDAASIYETQANAAATYSTQAAVAASLVPYLKSADAAATYATILGVQSAFLRITDAAAIYLSQTAAASTYFKIAGGTITGPVQFNTIPVLNATLPPVTDSSGDVASSAWTQAVITSRVGTGPFIPTTGVGMFYDIAFPYIGPSATSPYPSSFNVLSYTFARKVAFPANFGAPHVACVNLPTNTTVLTVSRIGSVAGVIGSLTFAPGGKCSGLFSGVAAQTFLPGDTLTIFTNESASNPAIADPTLGGIGGTIPGAISQ